MSYNLPNWGSIAANLGPPPNHYIWVGVTFGGSDLGAQFMQADPESSGAQLVSYDHEMDNNNGQITYWFKLSNTGSERTSFALRGGGVV